MSKKYLVGMGALAMVATAIQANDFSNQTTFVVRQWFQSSMPDRLTGFRDQAGACPDGRDGAFQVVLFGGRSTKAQDLGKYFGLNGKSELIVAGNQAFATSLEANPYQRDINALQFNIQNVNPNTTPGTTTIDQTFLSTIKFRPRQSFYGIGLDYKQYFGCERKWWFEASLPIVHVKNNMNLTEDVQTKITPVTGANANMIEAFTGQKGFVNQPDGNAVTGQVWNFGKIDGARKKTGVADVEVKVGYDYLREETYHLGNWAGLVLPAGNKIKGEFVFEAQVPRGHFGFMLGTSAGFEIWCGCDSVLRWEFDANTRYLLSNTQTRSFDVNNKPWSRYMLVFSDFAAAADNEVTNGINIFTRHVKVKPRFDYTMNTAFVYDYCRFTGEIGYNFWARQAEKVSLKNPWVAGPAFVGINDISSIEFVAQRINRAIQIGEDFQAANTTPATADAYARLAIQETDLNLSSAAHPGALSNTIYAYVGYDADWCCWPMHLGIGGSYEFSGENTAINRWNIWGKFVVSI